MAPPLVPESFCPKRPFVLILKSRIKGKKKKKKKHRAINEAQQSVEDLMFGILMVCNNPANIWDHKQLLTTGLIPSWIVEFFYFTVHR